jgi:hypothetical protein
MEENGPVSYAKDFTCPAAKALILWKAYGDSTI